MAEEKINEEIVVEQANREQADQSDQSAQTEQSQTTGPNGSQERVYTEEFKVKGEELVGKVKGLLHEGNIRRVIIRTEAGKTLLDIPLTFGVLGAAAGIIFLPVLTAIAAIAGIVSKVKVTIEKLEKV